MKKEGFTLIELLAVILILGIIALIAIPTTSKILDSAKKGAFETTLKNIEKKVNDICSVQQLKGTAYTNSYTIANGIISPSLDIKGDLPDGTISVDNNCDTTFELQNKTYKGVKETPKGEIIISKANGEKISNTLLSNIYKNNTIINTPITSPGITINNFTEASLIGNQDDDGVTYYFRGSNVDNYVQLGVYPQDIWIASDSFEKFYDNESDCGSGCIKVAKGTPMIFKIVRINGDNSIRLVLQYSLTTLAYNSTFNDEKYVGYTFDKNTTEAKSDIKEYLDNWYNSLLTNNPGIENLISSAKFCNDTTKSSTDSRYYGSWQRVVTAINPSFKCPEGQNTNYGGLYNLKIGLLTADELAFAGLQNEDYNFNNYLYTENKDANWTMSPGAYKTGSANVYLDGGYINMMPVDSTFFGVRPVINLKETAEIISGDGKKATPYIIKIN